MKQCNDVKTARNVIKKRKINSLKDYAIEQRDALVTGMIP